VGEYGMVRNAATTKPKRERAPRWGIAEWFGADLLEMSEDARQASAITALKRLSKDEAEPPRPCPFLATIVPGATCNKTSGVCSIRKYSTDGSATTDQPTTVCPNRFLEPLVDGKSIFVWISAKMLDVSNPIVVKETPFLRKILDNPDAELPLDTEDETSQEKKAGRIDWIVLDPASLLKDDLAWCAVETQALYFSGGAMRPEFEAYALAPSAALYPTGNRRPDYRSSGPKRLWPQLDVKVPSLRNWGKKVVVVVDRFFYENMNALKEAFPRARDDKERRDNADVVWFIVDFRADMRLQEHLVIYTTLERTRHALNATEPLSKDVFTSNLRSTIENPRRSNKVFKVS
jgi:hypothetical protein